MATVIKIKKSETSGSAPTTSDLVAGEVALNTADKIAYVRDSSNQIIKFANYTDADESLTFHRRLGKCSFQFKYRCFWTTSG